MNEENMHVIEDMEPDFPSQTDEEVEQWEREREEREAAKIAPFWAVAQAMRDRDDLLSDILLEMTLNELEG